jgi:hypothetical protein
MTVEIDWESAEARLARLLPDGNAPNRARLLNELSAHARKVVQAARRAGIGAPADADIAGALNWLNKPVFICGHHRSGTTLLQQLLDGHPQLVVLPSEATFLSSYRYVARPDPDPDSVDRFIADWIARFVDPNDAPHFKLGQSTRSANPYIRFSRRLLGWNVALRRSWPDRAAFTLLLALVAAYQDLVPLARAPALWVEKTPLNEHNTMRFAAFEQARFIQVVRDPASTLASLAQSYRKAGVLNFNSARHAHAIGRSLQMATRNRHMLGERFHLLRYEDLTHDPLRAMQRVRDFLGIAADAALLTPTVGGRPVRSNSSFERGEVGVVRAPRAGPALPPSEASLVNTFAGSAARSLGYQIAQPGLLTRSAIHLRYLPARALRLVRALSS